MSDIDMDQLQAWIGRRAEQTIPIDVAQATRIAATLDHDEAPVVGQPLAPLWHWAYFTPSARQSELGTDGHPKRGGFMPPIPLPRRMWAGGKLRFYEPILVGDVVTRITEIRDVVAKPGSQGPLVFVALRHSLTTERGVAIEEDQDIVYRGESVGNPAPMPLPSVLDPAPAEWRDVQLFDPTLLFRYSALTFNAHRIHYDLPYAQQAERYPGLVVHGPLTATCLVDRLLAHTGRRLTGFSFRGKHPLIASDRGANLCGRTGERDGSYELWAESPDGHVTMIATATTEAGHAS